MRIPDSAFLDSTFISDTKLSFLFVSGKTIKLLYPNFLITKDEKGFRLVNFRVNFDTKVSAISICTVVPRFPDIRISKHQKA